MSHEGDARLFTLEAGGQVVVVRTIGSGEDILPCGRQCQWRPIFVVCSEMLARNKVVGGCW